MTWVQTTIALVVAVLALRAARRTRRTIAVGVSAGIEAERHEAKRVEAMRLAEFVRTSAAATSAAREAEFRLVRLLDEAHAEQLAFEGTQKIKYDVPARRRAVASRIEQKLHRGGFAQPADLHIRVRAKR